MQLPIKATALKYIFIENNTIRYFVFCSSLRLLF